MGQFSTKNINDFQPGLQPILSEIKQDMGVNMVPNFFLTQFTHSQSVARGSWGLMSNILTSGLLPRVLKEMIFVSISSARNCKYCEAAHKAMCKAYGLDESNIEALVKDIHKLTPERAKKIILFSIKTATEPQSLTDADYDELRALGMTQAEILEVIAMAGAAVYANIMADAMKVEVDDELSAFFSCAS